MDLTLYYLPLRARAEPIRMVLAYGGIPHNFVTVSMSDWSAAKTNKAIAPFGQLPTLALSNGDVIAEAGAIIRFVAKLAKIYPDDPLLAAKADMVFEFALEMNVINPIMNFWPVNTEAWQTNYVNFFNNLPRNLTILQEMLGDKQFYGGSSPHHGDFTVFHILDACVTVKGDCLDAFPIMQEYGLRVRSIPAIDAYLRDRAPPHAIGLCGSFMQVEVAKVFHR